MAIGYPGTAVAVTATGSGTLTPPNQSVFGWAVVTNVSPWIATVTGLAEGSGTLQPFEQDMLELSPAGSIGYSMSVPPGGSSTAPASQPAYLQVDWYLASQGPPAGSWPFSLTAQALASIAGAITASYVETLLATVPSGTVSTTVTLPVGTQVVRISIPTGAAGVPTVVGVTSTQSYLPALIGLFWVAIVDQPLDSQVTITYAAATSTWYVLATNATQMVGHMSEGSAGHPIPTNTLQIGGTDGANLRTLGVDGSNRITAKILGHSGGTLDAAPGTAVPAIGLLVGGSDGTNFQDLSVTAPGAAAPAEAQVVQTVSDGTNTHLAKSDTGGGILSGQVPNLKTASIDASIAAGATSSIVAAVGGKTITVYMVVGSACVTALTVGSYVIGFDSTTTAVFVVRGRGRVFTAVGAAPEISLSTGWISGGFALPIGEGLQAVTAAGNAGSMDVDAVVYYTQL